MVTASIGELRRSNVDDALTGTAGHLMYKAHQVLVGIPEAHAAAYATLKETGRTREVEGDHALVLVPNVNHTIQPLVAAFHGKLVQQAVPHPAQLVESGIHGLYGRKTGY